MIDSIQRLTASADELTKRVAEMDRGAAARDEVLARQSQMTRRLVWFSWAVLAVLAAALTVAVVALVGVGRTAHRLDVSDTTSRQSALCPLYQVLINAESPKARAHAVDKAEFDKAYAVIHQGYKALNCIEFKGSAPKLG